MENKKELQKARNYAFLLLKFRLRSEKEINLRLKKKKFAEEVIKHTILSFKDKGFIDDALFAKSWIAWRLKKPFGLRRIIQELNLKGIGREIIDSQINAVKEGYSEPDLVAKITKERMNKLKGIQPAAAKRRVYAYLLRRGFSPESVIDAMNEFES